MTEQEQSQLPEADPGQSETTPETLDQRRMVEAVLFAADRPLSEDEIAGRLDGVINVSNHLDVLRDDYASRGVQLVCVAGRWQFRTAPDLSFLLRQEVEEQRRLSRAAVETLAIIAYHQPVTRAEIEEIRGVGLSKGTLDVLMEAGWIRPRGRRKTPGRPLQYGTSDEFLIHFGLEDIKDLPGFEELKAAGLLDGVDETMDRLAEEQRLAALARQAADGQIDLEDVIDRSLRQDDDLDDSNEADGSDAGTEDIDDADIQQADIEDDGIEDGRDDR